MKKKIIALALTLIGAAAVNASAYSYNNGDLYLGFEASGGTGSTNNLIIDLGGAASLSSLNINLGTDLANTYGTNWYSRTDLYYGVIGYVSGNTAVNGFVAKTLWASVISGNTPWTRTSAASQNTIGANVGGLAIQNQTDANNGQTGVADQSVIQYNGGTETATWSSYSSAFGSSFGFSGSIEGAVTNNLDVIQLRPSTTNGLGANIATITIGSNGAISAVPEPATYALFGLGALVLIVAARRKNA